MTPALHDADEHSPHPFSRRSRYILVVEGRTNDLFTTAMLLQRFNYPVCTARNARQALDMVSVAMPALVVAQSVLPGMSGIEMLRVLASNSRTFSIPVILLLPADGAGLEREDVEIGGAFVLTEPVEVEDLYRVVQTAMERTPRANIRVQTALPVAVNRTALDAKRGECAIELSSQGIYIRTFKYYRPGEKIALQLTIDGHAISADGTILYIRRQDESPLAEPGMAVKFTRITGEDRERIRRFIHEQVTGGIVTAEP